jgi:hypothetical protein
MSEEEMEFLCLDCPLDDCNEESKQCLIQIERARVEANKSRWVKWYAKNREKRAAYVKERKAKKRGLKEATA